MPDTEPWCQVDVDVVKLSDFEREMSLLTSYLSVSCVVTKYDPAPPPLLLLLSVSTLASPSK